MASYIDYINNFWRVDEQQLFSANETRLYFYLLHFANRLFWEQEWFEYSDKRATAYVGMSVDALRTSRERLKTAMLIDFVSGGKGYRVKTRYTILTPNLPSKTEPNSEPVYSNKTKTKTKTKTNFNVDEKYSRRQSVISGSNFD